MLHTKVPSRSSSFVASYLPGAGAVPTAGSQPGAANAFCLAGGTGKVTHHFDILRGGIDATLRGIGVDSTANLTPDDVIVPDGVSPPPF